MHKIVFQIEPTAASRPRVFQKGAYRGAYYTGAYKQFRSDMDSMLTGKVTLYGEPLKLEVTFYCLIPKSYSKKKRDEMDGTYKPTKPDLDNFEKAFYDSLNEVIWKDDAQVVDHHVRKIWTKDNPRIVVIIERIYDNTKRVDEEAESVGATTPRQDEDDAET